MVPNAASLTWHRGRGSDADRLAAISSAAQRRRAPRRHEHLAGCHCIEANAEAQIGHSAGEEHRLVYGRYVGCHAMGSLSGRISAAAAPAWLVLELWPFSQSIRVHYP
jgi:hypothetical protein